MSWSTYLGGATANTVESPFLHGIAALPGGDVVVAGRTEDPMFPATAGSLQPTFGGGRSDGFVARVGPGGVCRWATFLGGSATDALRGVAVDAAGDVFVVGYTDSPGLATPAAYRQAPVGLEIYVACLDGADSALKWATYVGAAGAETGDALALMPNGDLLVAGTSNSAGFPVTGSAPQPVLAGGFDAVALILDSSGANLRASTFLGGSGDEMPRDVAVGPRGEVVLAGTVSGPGATFPTTRGAHRAGPVAGPSDCFVATLSGNLARISSATLLGASGRDDARAVGLGPAGEVHVGGWTTSTGFATTVGAPQRRYGGGIWDGFLTVLDPALNTVNWSTFVGGASTDGVNDLVVGPSGLVSLCAETSSSGLWTTGGAAAPSYLGGSRDGFLARLDPLARTGRDVLYASYVGSGGDEGMVGLCIDARGEVVLTGAAKDGFPTSPTASQRSFAGGYFDVVLAAFPALPGNVGRGGNSTPDCHGAIRSLVDSEPRPGAARFSFIATGAPRRPGSAAVLLLGNPAGQPWQAWNADVWIGRPGLVTASGTIDPTGFAFLSLQLPSTLPSPVVGVAAQWIFVGSGQCAESGVLAASDRLAF